MMWFIVGYVVAYCLRCGCFSLEMRLLNVRNLVVHCWKCSGSLLEIWRLFFENLMVHGDGWKCIGSQLEMYWLTVGNVLAHCWKCIGSLLKKTWLMGWRCLGPLCVVHDFLVENPGRVGRFLKKKKKRCFIRCITL